MSAAGNKGGVSKWLSSRASKAAKTVKALGKADANGKELKVVAEELGKLRAQIEGQGAALKKLEKAVKAQKGAVGGSQSAGDFVLLNSGKLHFVVGTSKSDGYVFSEIFKKDLYQFDPVIEAVGTGGAVIDIGAHKGFFTCMAGSRFPKVVSFEASDVNYRFLKRNIALNDLSNVEAVYSAVFSSDGQVEFHKSRSTDARNAIQPSSFAGQTDVEVVPAISLNTAFERYAIERCSVLKIDCEGAELDILSALSNDNFARVDLFLMELHEDVASQGRVIKTLDLLSSKGFEIMITADKLMKNDLYTCMAIAVNRTAVPDAARAKLFSKITRVELYQGRDFVTPDRLTFQQRCSGGKGGATVLQ